MLSEVKGFARTDEEFRTQDEEFRTQDEEKKAQAKVPWSCYLMDILTQHSSHDHLVRRRFYFLTLFGQKRRRFAISG